MDAIAVLFLIGWAIFRAVSRNVKKSAHIPAPRDPLKPVRQPTWTSPAGGGWAKMLGIPAEGERRAMLSEAQKEAAFAASPPLPAAQDDYVSPEGADPCHDSMLRVHPENAGKGEPAPPPPSVSAPIPGLVFRLDAPTIVQGVVLSEILARPMHRAGRRAWPSRR